MQAMTAQEIRRQIEVLPPQIKPRAGDPVGKAPAQGAGVAQWPQIRRQRLRADHQRVIDPVQPQILHDAAQRQDMGGQPAAAQGDALHRRAVRGMAKGLGPQGVHRMTRCSA